MEPADIKSNDLITEIVYETVLQDKCPTFDAGNNPFNQNETNIQEKKFITSQADIKIHCKIDLMGCNN